MLKFTITGALNIGRFAVNIGCFMVDTNNIGHFAPYCNFGCQYRVYLCYLLIVVAIWGEFGKMNVNIGWLQKGAIGMNCNMGWFRRLKSIPLIVFTYKH